MATITVQPDVLLERILTLEIVRVTERAAVSCARSDVTAALSSSMLSKDDPWEEPCARSFPCA